MLNKENDLGKAQIAVDRSLEITSSTENVIFVGSYSCCCSLDLHKLCLQLNIIYDMVCSKRFHFFFFTPIHFLSCYYCDMLVRKLTGVITRRGLGFSRVLTGYNKL